MKRLYLRWKLVGYDALVFFSSVVFLKLTSWSMRSVPLEVIIPPVIVFAAILLIGRIIGGIYQQIWRYGGIQCYVRLVIVDILIFPFNFLASVLIPFQRLRFSDMLLLSCLVLLGTLTIRMLYRYCYKCCNRRSMSGYISEKLLRIFAGKEFAFVDAQVQKIKIAIIGAGRLGVNLADELLNNAKSPYLPRCFIDQKRDKAGREIHDLPVLPEDPSALPELHDLEVQEVVIAIPNQEEADRRDLYERYSKAGFKVKVYDYPSMRVAGAKRQLRNFDVEELLFRQPVSFADEKTKAYYRDKIVMITGGGGSIGSELCRQLAAMEPKQIIIVDIYENGAYDVQQELKIQYGSKIDLQIEIVSITNRAGMARLFESYHPQIVINAAAHKHVPLMEHNCVEAVENNVFGTQNLVSLVEAYHAERFMMVSTDKAVNPTNVMGATKRMCEMIVQSASTYGKAKYSATRFGNVLGSAGSVIPLFKRQIAAGGPVTLTDKRIIRYFMTIPEASQLVLQSGAMANNGELFVLDMGQPVKILDLAENMIRLSEAENIEIVETGLRPGEKLYEELLVKTEQLEKTSNSMIFVEKDAPLSRQQINQKLHLLRKACETGDNDYVRDILKVVVPTFKSPEEVNAEAENAAEMKHRKALV